MNPQVKLHYLPRIRHSTIKDKKGTIKEAVRDSSSFWNFCHYINRQEVNGGDTNVL